MGEIINTEDKKNPGQLVFGLDIGTRSLVGTVGYKSGNVFHVVAQCVREHESRSMLDGQIHDINTVGQSIVEVKRNLEGQIGRELNEVCIAAAGRVLKTVTVEAQIDFNEEKIIEMEDIHSLEMLGVEKAFEELQAKNDSDTKFYCVGYTVVHYFMNDYQIGALEKHKAKKISVELIATFLPDEVVDGLYRAVEAANLLVANLPLEPIAAIQVAIPVNFRMLNIALVDVGAGTSDICITKDGSIIAYGMIPMAGDEITEVIAKHCLVDFTTAEMIKTSVVAKKPIKYSDIMGIQQRISAEEVLEITEPVVKNMTTEIANKIKELNGGEPVSAVFVVGGGGKLPTFTDYLAKGIGIDPQRCALRGAEVLKEIDYQIPNPNLDSLFVTPIGICLNFYDSKNNFIFVNFNDERVKLYDNGHLLVVDAAIQAGFPNEGLFPKRGQALSFTVNGIPHMIRGELGESAIVMVNDEEVSINSPLRAGDKVSVTPSVAGNPAHALINSLSEYDSSLVVNVNGKNVSLPKYAEVNGELQSGYYEIKESDSIRMLDYYTVRQIADFMDVILVQDMNIYVNNKLADMDTKVYANFSIIWTMEELKLSDVTDESPTPENFADLPEDDGEYEENKLRNEQENDKRLTKNADEDDDTDNTTEENASETIGAEDEENSEEKTEDSTTDESADKSEGDVSDNSDSSEDTSVEQGMNVYVNGEPVRMTGKKEYIYVDIFEFIDFDLSRPQGRLVITKLNDRIAMYSENLHEGDKLDIYWEK